MSDDHADQTDPQPRDAPGLRHLDRGEPVIRVRDLVKRFGDLTVLNGVNLEVYPGETMVIMGGSGSGKSTMLRNMIGSLKPEEGSVELFGQDICGLGEDEMNNVRKKFGILFQSGAVQQHDRRRERRPAAAGAHRP
ncbi:MAG: ATP-binding cassette domain-containing protein [Phycisphaerales bacterium]